MAISWGSKKTSSSGNWMRLGYELTQSPSSVGTGTSSVVVTLKVYVQTHFPVSDSSNTFTITGNFSQSGSETISHGGNDQTTLLQTETRTVTTSYTSTTTSSFTASLTGINAIPGTASVSGSITTAKRPISPPATPSNIQVSRNSDTSHTITWTNTSPSSSSNPYQNIEIQRWSKATDTWATIATLGVVSSYTNTSTNANNQFRWRLRAKNSAGSSSYIYSGYWSTTPTSPNAPVASKISDDIKLDWTNRNLVDSGGVEVWWSANGGAYTLRATLPGNPSPSTYTHLNPNAAQTHRYALKAYAGATDDAPTTYSGLSTASNIIQLLTNPAAPNNLSPTSGVKDADTQAITLSWKHNEVDGTAQTKYDIQYRMNGGSWTTVSATTSVQSKTFAAGTLTNGGTFEWQVRTYGAYAVAPAYSPWSAIATITLSSAPSAGVIFPDGAIPVDTSRITAQWSYVDPEGTAQAQYRVKLYSAGGASVLEDKSGSGAQTTLDLTTLLKDATSYRLGVSVKDGSGLWSPEATEDFTVAYALPPVPTMELLWDPDKGSVQVAIQNPVAVGDDAETSYNEVWRSVDWLTYELVATNVPINSTVTDYIPALDAENVYLVVAMTDIGASAQSDPAVFYVPDTGGWFWFNGGSAFSDVIKVRYNPSRSRTFARSKTLNNYAGREFPVETAGEQRSRDFDLSFAAFDEDDAGLEDLERVADLPAPICVRTPTNDRKYVSIESVGTTSDGAYESVAMKMTQIALPQTETMDFEPVVYRTNWAENPSFEVDATTNIVVGASITAATSTEQSFVGNQAAKVTLAAGVSSFKYFGQSTVIEPGYSYMKASVKVRFLSGHQYYRARIGYRDNPTTGTINYTTVSSGITATDWETIEIETAIPSTSQYINVLVYVTDGPESMAVSLASEFFVDAFCFSLGTSAGDAADPEYFDGSNYEGDAILTASWVGTPGLSRSVLTRGGQ